MHIGSDGAAESQSQLFDCSPRKASRRNDYKCNRFPLPTGDKNGKFPVSNGMKRVHKILSEDEVKAGKTTCWMELEISGPVRYLSEDLWQFRHLTALFLNGNHLTRIPSKISNLTCLQILDLSHNKLRSLPSQLGDLVSLIHLYLHFNQLRVLPYELGKLFRLRSLGLSGNPLSPEISRIYNEKKGTTKLLQYLLDNLSFNTDSSPTRSWVQLSEPPTEKTVPKFTILCYNILCDKYATPSLYSYCPSWALDWDYRKVKILDEIKQYDADIVTLQEVETHEYYSYFKPSMVGKGYDCIFLAKSRAKTMTDDEKRYVDGCAIFWKIGKFCLESEHTIEFTKLAIDHASGSEQMLNRVMTRDNIGLVAVLTVREKIYDEKSGPPPTAEDSVVGSPLVVCTAHIHWDPEFCDVKLIQSMMLVQELQAIIEQTALAWSAGRLSSGEPCPHSGGANGNSGSSNSDQGSLEDDGKNEGKGATGFGADERGDCGYGISGTNERTNCEISLNEELPICGDSLTTTLVTKDVPFLICGDLNSLPESGVYEFLSTGSISANHADFKKFRDDPCLDKFCFSSQDNCYLHDLELESAYTPELMPYTNYTFDFKGMIDYMFASRRTLKRLGVLGPISTNWLSQNKILGCPHPLIPSDHFLLHAQYCIIPPKERSSRRAHIQPHQLAYDRSAGTDFSCSGLQPSTANTDYLQGPTAFPCHASRSSESSNPDRRQQHHPKLSASTVAAGNIGINSHHYQQQQQQVYQQHNHHHHHHNPHRSNNTTSSLPFTMSHHHRHYHNHPHQPCSIQDQTDASEESVTSMAVAVSTASHMTTHSSTGVASMIPVANYIDGHSSYATCTGYLTNTTNAVSVGRSGYHHLLNQQDQYPSNYPTNPVRQDTAPSSAFIPFSMVSGMENSFRSEDWDMGGGGL